MIWKKYIFQTQWRSSSSDFVEKCRNTIPSQRIDPEAWVDHVTALNSLKLIEEEQVCDEFCSLQQPQQQQPCCCSISSCQQLQQQKCVHPLQQQQQQQQHCGQRPCQLQQHITPSTASTMMVQDWKGLCYKLTRPWGSYMLLGKLGCHQITSSLYIDP